MTTYDPALFFLREENGLLGWLVVHVDDVIWCGSEKFERKIIQSVKSTYKIGKEATDSFECLGFDLCCSEEHIKFSQEIYMADSKTKPVHPDRARQTTEPLNKHGTKQLTRPDIAKKQGLVRKKYRSFVVLKELFRS